MYGTCAEAAANWRALMDWSPVILAAACFIAALGALALIARRE